MKRTFFLILAIFLSGTMAQAQQKITLEQIWQDYLFAAKSVPGFNFLNDGKHYTRLESNKIQQYDLTTGALVKTIFDASKAKDFKGEVDSYSFSADESKILIQTESESVYRHSTLGYFYVFDRKSETAVAVYPGGKHRNALLNPAADKVAYVFNNNLYCKDLVSGLIYPVTEDGKMNEIINGATDWVYEEEFSFDQAFQWSPDGKRIAYYRFDERKVPEFTLTNFRGGLHPEYVTFKYPKVGDPNAQVTIQIHDLEQKISLDAAVSTTADYYIPRIKWTQDAEKLCVFRMNRHQSDLELLLVDARNGKTTSLLRETSKTYLDIHDNLTFLKDGKHFIWTSEMDGWNHLYLYDMSGKLVRQLTQGAWEVTNFYGIDEKNGLLFYQAAEKSPLERQIHAVSLNGKKKLKLADKAGWNDAQFSSTFDYYVLTHSTANAPATYAVYNRDGKEVRAIENNARLQQTQKDFGVSNVEFFKFTTSEQVELNGWMIKPANFDENIRYPVLMYLYGGPGSQEVTDRWKGQNYWWFQMLAQQGYLVACIDNRGTGGRGEAFKKMTYLQLGKYETVDQIEGAKYIGGLKYADPGRIGIFGWSYGGYMSSLCLLKGDGVFKGAIAVAPVTNWKWYDSIYTERYMRTEAENAEGYRDNSPVNFADRLKGDYLLIHGMGDDNVHFQNAAEMANALIAANKQYETYFYPNRNHGIAGGKTRLHLYNKMTNFLNEKIKGAYGGKRPTSPVMIVPIEDGQKN